MSDMRTNSPMPTPQKQPGLLQRIFNKKTEPVQKKAGFNVMDLKKQKYVSGNPKISRYYYEYMSLSRDFVAKFKDFEFCNELRKSKKFAKNF